MTFQLYSMNCIAIRHQRPRPVQTGFVQHVAFWDSVFEYRLGLVVSLNTGQGAAAPLPKTAP